MVPCPGADMTGQRAGSLHSTSQRLRPQLGAAQGPKQGVVARESVSGGKTSCPNRALRLAVSTSPPRRSGWPRSNQAPSDLSSWPRFLNPPRWGPGRRPQGLHTCFACKGPGLAPHSTPPLAHSLFSSPHPLSPTHALRPVVCAPKILGSGSPKWKAEGRRADPLGGASAFPGSPRVSGVRPRQFPRAVGEDTPHPSGLLLTCLSTHCGEPGVHTGLLWTFLLDIRFAVQPVPLPPTPRPSHSPLPAPSPSLRPSSPSQRALEAPFAKPSRMGDKCWPQPRLADIPGGRGLLVTAPLHTLWDSWLRGAVGLGEGGHPAAPSTGGILCEVRGLPPSMAQTPGGQGACLGM